MNMYRCVGCTEYGPCYCITVRSNKKPFGCILEQDSSAPWDLIE